MKSYEEIMNDVISHKYVSESGPILEFIRQLASEGRLSEVSASVEAYTTKVPASKAFIASSLPAIILNSYIYHNTQATYKNFENWLLSDGTWAEEIRSSAFNSGQFVAAISNILARIK